MMTDESGKKFVNRIAAGVLEQLSFDPTPQALKPIVEQIANKDFFSGRDIVSPSLERQVPVEQYRSSTSLTARKAAEIMDALLTPATGKTGLDALRSPVRIEHLVKGYLGGLGMTMLGLSDVVLQNATNAPEAPQKRLEEYPIIRSLYRGDKDTQHRSRFESELYDTLRTADKVHAMFKAKIEDGENVREARKELSKEELVAFAYRKGLHLVARQLQKLNQAEERIRNSRKLSPVQKQAALERIRERKNILTKRIMKKIEQRKKAA